MGFIVDSLANIFLEALDTLIIWICDLSASFNLDIGEPNSVFYQTFLERSTEAQSTFSTFGFGIGVLAILIVLLVTIFKIYQLMADPFTQADSPGSIFLRFIFAGIGVVGSYEIFKYFEKGFNAAYQLFSGPYESITKTYQQRSGLILEKIEDITGSETTNRNNGYTHGNESNADVLQDNSGDAFIFGKNKLINPEETIVSHSLALALIELVVGGALLICLVKLIFEIYERYVIIAVLYLFSPLAFATIVSRQSTVFKNYIIMVASQFVLMCTNLVFLGVFMRAWYDIFVDRINEPFFFENSQEFITTMLLMIGWLIAGQKFDEHMRSLGLSAAQTGQGIMGAALGSLFLARAAIGGVVGAVGAGLGTTGKALTGQTGMQKAWQEGVSSDGQRGGLMGKVANAWENRNGSSFKGGATTFTGGNSISENLSSMAEAEGMSLSAATTANFGDGGNMSVYQDKSGDGRGVLIPRDEAAMRWMNDNISSENQRTLGVGDADGHTVTAAVFDLSSAPADLKNYLQLNNTQRDIATNNDKYKEFM